MLTAVQRATGPLGGGARTPRGFCECQDRSHPMRVPLGTLAPAGSAEHGYRAPFIVRGPRFLHTTPVGAYPICGGCHALGHMSVGGPNAHAEPVTG